MYGTPAMDVHACSVIAAQKPGRTRLAPGNTTEAPAHRCEFSTDRPYE